MRLPGQGAANKLWFENGNSIWLANPPVAPVTLDCEPHLIKSLAWKAWDLHANKQSMENMEIQYVVGPKLAQASKQTDCRFHH